MTHRISLLQGLFVQMHRADAVETLALQEQNLKTQSPSHDFRQNQRPSPLGHVACKLSEELSQLADLFVYLSELVVEICKADQQENLHFHRVYRLRWEYCSENQAESPAKLAVGIVAKTDVTHFQLNHQNAVQGQKEIFDVTNFLEGLDSTPDELVAFELFHK